MIAYLQPEAALPLLTCCEGESINLVTFIAVPQPQELSCQYESSLDR